MKVYIIGSLRNEEVPIVAKEIREAMPYTCVFDDWYSAGPRADDHLWDYEKARGHTAQEALQGYAAEHIFEFDKHHLETSDAVVLVMPAGKSAFLELGYCIGRGKPGFILMEENPERIDIMFQFATVCHGLAEVIDNLKDVQQFQELVPDHRLP